MLNNKSSLESIGCNNEADKSHIRKTLVSVAVCLSFVSREVCAAVVAVVLLANHQPSKFTAPDDVGVTGRPGDFCAMNKKDGEGYVSSNKAITDHPESDVGDPGNENNNKIIWRSPCDVYDLYLIALTDHGDIKCDASLYEAMNHPDRAKATFAVHVHVMYDHRPEIVYGKISIVVSKDLQNRHIGRRCVLEMIMFAREKGMKAIKANIYSFNHQSLKMFQDIGFVQTDDEWFEYPIVAE
jgi:GNAT superfamily N-acetyltransferase